jgi:thiamine-phosphate diphosphorylase
VPTLLRVPALCLVTDRHRLTAGRPGRPVHALLEQVAGAAGAGVDLVQLRERDLDARTLFDLTTRCLQAIAGSPTRLLVNDRLDVALAAGAHGVHLRSDSMEAERARALVPPAFLIGRSVHAEDEVGGAGMPAAVDYLILGTVFASASKGERAPTLGLDSFGRLARRSAVPVLGIGGITLETAPEVLRHGGAGIAAIGLFLPEGDESPGQAAARAVRQLRARIAGAASVGTDRW